MKSEKNEKAQETKKFIVRYDQKYIRADELISHLVASFSLAADAAVLP